MTRWEGIPFIYSHNPFKRRSIYKLKTLYLHYHNAYGHQTCQSCDIMQGAPTHKFEWLFNEMILWGYMTNYIYLHLQKAHENQTRRNSDLLKKVTWGQLSVWIFLSPLSQELWPLNLAGCWLWGGFSAHKCLTYNRFNRL